MKILMYGWEFPPHITGGLGTACFGLSQSLSKLVTKLVFVLPKVLGPADAGSVEVLGAGDIQLSGESVPQAPPDPLDPPAPWPLVEISYVDSPLRPYHNDPEYLRSIAQAVAHRHKTQSQAHGSVRADAPGGMLEISGDYGANLFDEVMRYARLASRAVLREPFDLIHAHDWLTFPAGVEAKRMSGVPLIVHVHATEFDRSGDSIDKRVYEVERYGMEQADRIIAVSQRTKDMIVERYGIPAAKVVVVHNGVVPKPAKPHKPHPGSEKSVVFLGRITQQKGPEYFLEAAYLVLQRLPDVRFIMAGSGDMLPRMIDRMAQLGIVDRFHFTGFLNEERRDEVFSRADLFVLSSVSEPFGITPMEAMQHDVPVIVTKQSGVAEVLHAAVKVDFWDVRRMADAMINVLANEPLALDLASGGRRDVAAMSWERAASKVNQLYREMR